MPRPTSNVLPWAWMTVSLLLALGIGACAGGSEEIVAKVGVHPIAKAKFIHWLSVWGGSRSAEDAGLKREVMESLISAQWTIAEASELGVSVSDGEAERQLSLLDYAGRAGLAGGRLLSGEAALKRSLSARGLTHADRVWLVKLNLLTARLRRKCEQLSERAITRARIAKYFQAHRRRYVVGEERDYVFIVTFTRAKAEKARREVEAGEGFFSVQRRVSIDPPQLGGLRHLKRGEGLPEFTARVFKAKPHVLLGPTSLGQVWDVYEVRRIEPSHRQSLAQAEAGIRRLLARREAAHAPLTLTAALAKRWKARTSCSVGYVVSLCARSPV